MPQVEVVIEYHDEANSYHTSFDVPKYKIKADELKRLLTTQLPEQGFDVLVLLNPPLGKGFVECGPHWFVKRENGLEKKVRYPGLGAFEVTLHCRGQFSDRLPPSIQVWSKIRTHLWPDARRLTADLEHLLSVASQDGDVKDLVSRFRDHSSGDVSLRYKPALQSKTPSRFMQWRGNTRRRNEPMIFGLTPRLKAPIDAWSTIDVDKLAAARGQDDELVRRFREEVRDMEGRPSDMKVPKAMQSPSGEGSQRRRFSLPQSMGGSGQLQSWRPPSAASTRSDRGARGSARAPGPGASSAMRASSAGPSRAAQHSPARFTASAGSESRGRDSFPPASPSAGSAPSVHSAAEPMQHEESTPKMGSRNGSGSFHEAPEPAAAAAALPPKPPLPDTASTPPPTQQETTPRAAPAPTTNPQPAATPPPPTQPAATPPPPTQPAATPPPTQPAATPAPTPPPPTQPVATPPPAQPAATAPPTQPEAPERVEQPKPSAPEPVTPPPQPEAQPAAQPPQSTRPIDDLRQRLLQKYTSSRSVASIFEEAMRKDLDTPLNAEEFKEAVMYKSQLRVWEQAFAAKKLFEEVAAGREEASLRDLQRMLEKGWPAPPTPPPADKKKEEAVVEEERNPEAPPRPEVHKPDEAVSDYDSEFEDDPEDTQPKAPVAAAKAPVPASTPAPPPPAKPSVPAGEPPKPIAEPPAMQQPPPQQAAAAPAPPPPAPPAQPLAPKPPPSPAQPLPPKADVADEHDGYSEDFDEDDQRPAQEEPPKPATPKPAPAKPAPALNTSYKDDFEDDIPEEQEEQTKKVTPPSKERPSSAAPRPVPKSDGTAASTATTAAKNDGSDYDEDFDEDDPPEPAKKVTIQGQVYDYVEDNWLDSDQSSEPGEWEDIEENQEIF